MLTINLARDCKWSLDPLPGETFKWIPGLEGKYDVSDQGRVRSYCARNSHVRNAVSEYPRIVLRQQVVKHNGHLSVGMRNSNGKGINPYVHRMVALAFIGPRPVGMEIRHLNGNAKDNRLSNIVYGTHSANMLDREHHGKVKRRGTHPFAKLCADDVRIARARRASGETYVQIAKDFNVTPSAIRFSCRGYTWPGEDLGPTENGRDELKGEHCPWSKLTSAQVVAIRNRAADGESHEKMADEMNISRASISDIVHRRTWRTVL